MVLNLIKAFTGSSLELDFQHTLDTRVSVAAPNRTAFSGSLVNRQRLLSWVSVHGSIDAMAPQRERAFHEAYVGLGSHILARSFTA